MAETIEIPIAQSGHDGQVAASDSTWPPTTATQVLTNTPTIDVERQPEGANFTIINALLRFDTSVIPDQAVITSAKLRIYVTVNATENGKKALLEWYDAGTIGFEDFSGTPISNAGETQGPISTLTVDSDNDISLINLGNINKTGFTGIRIHLDATGDPPSGDEWLAFAAFDGSDPVPRLIVTYDTSAVPLVSDSFHRADADLDTAGWAKLGGVTSPMQIISDSAWGSSEPSGSVFTGTAFGNDQWAQCVLGTTAGGPTPDQGIGLCVRASTSALTCYIAIADNNEQVSVGKYVSGTYTSLAVTDVGHALAASVLRLEVEGTRLRVYVDGSQVGSDIVDTSIPSGQPGLVRKNSSGNNVDAFHAGTFDLGVDIVSTVFVDASGGDGGSTTVTVPEGATAVIAAWAAWDDGAVSRLASLTLAGSLIATDEQLDSDNVSGATGTGVAHLSSLPPTGSQTLAWTWVSGGPRSEGGGLYLVFVKNADVDSLVADTATDQQVGGNDPAVALNIVPGQIALGMFQRFGAGLAYPGPAYLLSEDAVNSETYALGVYGPDNTGVGLGLFQEDSDYSTIAGIVLRPTAPELPEKQTVVGFSRQVTFGRR